MNMIYERGQEQAIGKVDGEPLRRRYYCLLLFAVFPGRSLHVSAHCRED